MGRGLGFKNNVSGQNTHHDKRDTTTLHKERPKTTTQYGSNSIGHRQQHKGQEGRDNNTSREAAKKVETTIHHAKQPQLSVRGSMIESLNEEVEIKLSSLNVCCSSFQSLAAAN